MNEFGQSLIDLWDKYSPMVIAGVTTLSVLLGVVLLAWNKVKGLVETIKELKEKLFNKAVEEKNALTNEMFTIDLDTKILDLKNKINSPAIPDDIKQGYILQLAKLETMKSKIEAGLLKVDEVNKTF